MEKYNREIMSCHANASMLVIKTTETKGEDARLLEWETKKKFGKNPCFVFL